MVMVYKYKNINVEFIMDELILNGVKNVVSIESIDLIQ